MIVEDCKIKRKKRTLKEDVGGEFFLDGALRHCRSEAGHGDYELTGELIYCI